MFFKIIKLLSFKENFLKKMSNFDKTYFLYVLKQESFNNILIDFFTKKEIHSSFFEDFFTLNFLQNIRFNSQVFLKKEYFSNIASKFFLFSYEKKI